MGVVIRQGLKSTVVQYVGVAVGIVANLFLYTQVQDVYGLVQVLIQAANMLMPLAMLGSYMLSVRYFPVFDAETRKGFLASLYMLTALGVALVWGLWALAENLIIERLFAATDPALRPWFKVVPLLVLLFAFGKLAMQYTSNYRRIVVPTIIEQFAFKLVLPLLLLGYLYNVWTSDAVVIGTLVHYTLVLVGLLWYLHHLGGLKWAWPNAVLKAKRSEMLRFGSFSIASTFGQLLAFRIDVLMVAAFLDFAAAGQYAIVLFMSEVIAKPYVNLQTVVSPLVSSAWADNNMKELESLYKRSADNMLLICGYVYAGILVCYPAIVHLASRGEVLAGAFGAFAFLGAARVVDAACSINEYVIAYSKYYRFNLFATLILAVVNIALNLYLLPLYGLAGVGAATLISVSLYNLAKLLFAGFKFGLWPFGKTSLIILGALLLSYLGSAFMPLSGYWWLDILIRGGTLTVLLGTAIYFSNGSQELKQLLQLGLQRIGRR